MATTKDWAAAYPNDSDGYVTVTALFSDGEGAAYTAHAPPKWAKSAGVRNRGTGYGYVGVPANTGSDAAVATDNNVRLAAGESYTFPLVTGSDKHPPAASRWKFSTNGADGAGHVFEIQFYATRLTP